MVSQNEKLTFQERLKINKLILIAYIDGFRGRNYPAGIYFDWYIEKYGEGNGSLDFSKFGFQSSKTKLYSFWQEDVQFTRGEDYQHGLRQFHVGRIELIGVNDVYTDISIFCEWSPCQAHYEELANRLRTLVEKPEAKKISKKGPRKYSDEEKLKALKEWDDLDKSKYPINVQEWLVKKFGEESGIPNVAKSTFYGWKKLKGK